MMETLDLSVFSPVVDYISELSIGHAITLSAVVFFSLAFAWRQIRTHAQSKNLEQAEDESEDALSVPDALKHSPRAQVQHPMVDVGIVGMDVRYPGSETVEEFWATMINKRENIEWASIETLYHEGVLDAHRNPQFVPAHGTLTHTADFDAAFFGMSETDAKSTNPQQRLFFELCQCALERAGMNPKNQSDQRIGVYGGFGYNPYEEYLKKDQSGDVSVFQTVIGNHHDYPAARVSYLLGLTGPAVNIQTACSSGLVAFHTAAEALRHGECDAACAGAVSIILPESAGYTYMPNMMFSPDGKCRAFSVDASGTLFSSGGAVVILLPVTPKTLQHYTFSAVVKGSAINNDGSSKVSFLAPGVAGQTLVIQKALKNAGVSAESLGLIETHGTGTTLGDKIELTALTDAFDTAERSYCALGTTKPNIGHTGHAAGMAGLVKAVLCLQHSQLAPLLHCDVPNPELNLSSTPFYVPQKAVPWPRGSTPRRAGISAFGVGGTNAHVIIEDAPALPPDDESVKKDEWEIVPLSGKTQAAAMASLDNLKNHLKSISPDKWPRLQDVALTMQQGRTHHPWRLAVTVSSMETLLSRLSESASLVGKMIRFPRIVFVFPGQGTLYPGIARHLVDTSETFKKALHECAASLRSIDPSLDLFALLWPQNEKNLEGTRYSNNMPPGTHRAQLCAFSLMYALAQTWLSWGVEPRALIGHSLGEIAAATLAGVISLNDAIWLVHMRGVVMEKQPRGVMLAAALPEKQARQLIKDTGTGDEVSIASINSPQQCVFSGVSSAIQKISAVLADQAVKNVRLATSHGFHSPMMDPCVDEFEQLIRSRGMTFSSPSIPYVSCLTGTWIEAADAMDPHYWALHIRSAVLFDAGMKAMAQKLGRNSMVMIEMGHGTLLTKAPQNVFSLRRFDADSCDSQALYQAATQAWCIGLPINWSRVAPHESARRVPLPTTPFQRARYWPDSPVLVPSLQKMTDDLLHMAAETDLSDYHRYLQVRNELIFAYVIEMFGTLGYPFVIGNTFTSDSLHEQMAIIPEHHKAFDRFLTGILLDEGVISFDGMSTYTVQKNHSELPQSAQVTAKHHSLIEQFKYESAVIHNSGRQLAALVTGKVHVTKVLFGDDSFANMYHEAIVPSLYNKLTGQLVKHIASEMNQDKPLRIMEIGGGTGSTTSFVLEHLPADRTEYVFTDITPAFTTAAAKRWSVQYPFMKFEVVDVTKPPAAFPHLHPGTFDVIIANNVLHATPNLNLTMSHVQQYLAPGGYALVYELTTTDRFLDITAAFTDGWWQNNDGIRVPGCPAASVETWRDVLADVGFDRIGIVPRQEGLIDSLKGSVLITARAGQHRVPSVMPLITEESEESPKTQVTAAPSLRPDVANSDLEKAVQAIVQDVMGESVAVDQNLLMSSMDSLVATQIHTKLSTEYNVDLPYDLILQYPTITTLAGLLHDQGIPVGTVAETETSSTKPKPKPNQVSSPVPEGISSPPTTAPSHDKRYIGPLLTRSSVSCRLLLFPPLGMGEQCFLRWCDVLPPTVEPWLVAMDPPPQDWTELVTTLIAGIEKVLDDEIPFVCYGHSLGGMIAFETIRQLQLSGRPLPRHLIVAAVGAPSVLLNAFYLYPLSEMARTTPHDRMIELLKASMYYPPTGVPRVSDTCIFSDAVLLGRCRDVVLAQEEHQFKLSCPIMAVHADHDTVVMDPSTIFAWDRHTSKSFDSMMVNGAHHFCLFPPAPLLEMVSEKCMTSSLPLALASRPSFDPEFCLGTWELNAIRLYGAGNEIHRYSHDESRRPHGLLQYLPQGFFAAQISPRNVSALQPCDGSQIPLDRPSLESARSYYLAEVTYFGTYTFDAERGNVRHRVIHGHTPHWRDTVQTRHFKHEIPLEGPPKLTLATPPAGNYHVISQLNWSQHVDRDLSAWKIDSPTLSGVFILSAQGHFTLQVYHNDRAGMESTTSENTSLATTQDIVHAFQSHLVARGRVSELRSQDSAGSSSVVTQLAIEMCSLTSMIGASWSMLIPGCECELASVLKAPYVSVCLPTTDVLGTMGDGGVVIPEGWTNWVVLDDSHSEDGSTACESDQ